MKCRLAQASVVLTAGLTVLPLFVASPAAAQVNIERMRQKNRAEGASMLATASLSTRSGNVDATNLTIGGRAQYTRARRTAFVAFLGDYGWQGGRRYSDEGLVHGRYIHGLSGVVSAEAFAQTDYNKARLLDARGVVGGGARLTLVDRERAGLSFGSSYMYEHEELDLSEAAAHPVQTDAHRWNNYVGLRWAFNERAGVSVTGYAQPRFDDFDDVRVLGEGTVDAVIGGPVSLSVTASLRHDSAPPDGIESTDTKLVTGITISL